MRAEDGAEVMFRLATATATARPAGCAVQPAQGRRRLGAVHAGQHRATPSTRRAGSSRSPTRAASECGSPTPTPRITFTDASGRTAKATLEAGLIREISLPDHRKVKFFYTGTGCSPRTSTPAASSGSTRYGANGLLTEVINPDRVVAVHNEYDANGRVAGRLDALGKATTFEWRADRAGGA